MADFSFDFGSDGHAFRFDSDPGLPVPDPRTARLFEEPDFSFTQDPQLFTDSGPDAFSFDTTPRVSPVDGES